MFRLILMAATGLMLSFATAQAAERPPLTPEQRAEIQRLIKLRDSLHPVHGSILLPDAKAHLNLGTGYYFLGPEDARRVLTEGWGNPPEDAEGVLGLVFSDGQTFLDDTWGAVITYEKTDYVSDKDAASTDYDELLQEMRDGEASTNEARQKAGFVPIHIVGWAQSPTYDQTRHDLIWARELQFGQDADHTLNYDVRHLGRNGVLSLNMVTTMSQIASVQAGSHNLARTAEFDGGFRYADFQKGDPVAGFGLAGLVAAGAGLALAKKVGFVGIILLFAKKFIAIFAVAGAAGAAWLRNLFNRNKPATVSIVEADKSDPDDTTPTI